MYTESAEFYDLIYSTFKDYPGEAARIAELLRRLHPRCRTVLDVASGTGEHARLLAGLGFVVDGLDLDPAFVRIASRSQRPQRSRTVRRDGCQHGRLVGLTSISWLII